jgi:hypothetical protein
MRRSSLALAVLFSLFLTMPTRAGTTVSVTPPTSATWTASLTPAFAATINSDETKAFGFVDWNNSLVGWFRGEGNANDSSTLANHGIWKGTATYGPGTAGAALLDTAAILGVPP